MRNHVTWMRLPSTSGHFLPMVSQPTHSISTFALTAFTISPSVAGIALWPPFRHKCASLFAVGVGDGADGKETSVFAFLRSGLGHVEGEPVAGSTVRV